MPYVVMANPGLFDPRDFVPEKDSGIWKIIVQKPLQESDFLISRQMLSQTWDEPLVVVRRQNSPCQNCSGYAVQHYPQRRIEWKT
jgi:hypothetical protein